MPSFDAITAFGPLLTTVAEIGRPSADGHVLHSDAMVGAIHDDADGVAEAELACQLEELGAVAERADLRGHDEEDLVRDGEHRHRPIVVAGVVVDDHVGVMVAAPAQRREQQVDGDALRLARDRVPQVRTRTPLSA